VNGSSRPCYIALSAVLAEVVSGGDISYHCRYCRCLCWVYIFVTLVCREFCDGLGEGLDLCQHCVKLGGLHLCVCCMVIVGRCCTRYLGNVYGFCCHSLQIGLQTCTFLTFNTAACVLLVCVGCFHQHLKVLLGKLAVGLGGGGLSLPIEHFILVKMVAVIHFLQVKLEFVFVCDCYIGADKHALGIVEVLPNDSEMFFTIPLGVVCIFKCFLCFDIKGAPAVIQMFQDLKGSDVAVCREAMLQLGIVLSRASRRLLTIPQETFPDEARGADEVPILLFAFGFMCGHFVVDGLVIQRRFSRDLVGGDVGEFVVLVNTKYVTVESVVVCY
jgi:hypothetical protein